MMPVLKILTNKNEQWELLVFELNELRKKNKISILKISQITGVAPSHVSRFFSCKFEPKLSTYLKIDKAVKVLKKQHLIK